jgi:PAS domain S-box-containing protein
LFEAAGEMPALLRRQDWSQTPLGDPAQWPQSLRLSVSLCLNSRFPMAIWWGRDLILIYNDAYGPILGQRHPAALGRSARVVWADVWAQIGPQIEAVLDRGESTWNERTLVPTDRNGVMEQAWFTWSFSPIIGESGQVAGVFLAAFEETARVHSEQELHEARDRLAATLSAAEIGSWNFDVIKNQITADANLARLYSIAPEVAAAGAPLAQFTAAIHPEDLAKTEAAIAAALASGNHYAAEYRLRPQRGVVRWVIARGRVLRDATGRAIAMPGVLVDITERKQSEELVAVQIEALRLMASESSLPHILAELVRHVEARGGEDTVASILLVDDAGKLRHGAAPSLPDAFNRAVDGIPIGEFVGTCGRTAFLREVVVTPDLAADPNWAPLREEAAALGLRSAWSVPIVSTKGKVLGTFGTYFRQKRTPTPEEQSTVDFLSKTAALAIERAQAHEILRESESRFRTLADNMSQFAWMADGTGALFWYNQRWFDYTGTTFEAMQGWGWQQVQHPDHVDRVREKFIRHVQDGTVWEDTFPLRSAAGEFRWFLSRAFPIRDAQGAVVRWFGTNTDITALREAQEALRLSETRFRQIADTLPQIVWGAGTDGVLDYYNRRWFEYIARPETDVEGARWDQYIHPEDLPSTYETWVAALASGESYQTEFRVRRADGVYRWFLARALPIRDAQDKVVRWFGTCTDIDDRKRMQEENLQMIERERAARLASETAGRMKDDFLATLSHELRTPLNPVLLLATDSAANPSLPAEVRADFETIAKNVALEARLIDDLLDLTRITRGKLALTVGPIDLHSVLRDAIANVVGDLADHQIHFVTDFSAPQASVVGDSVRLQQVFWNILRNAAKFTPPKGTVILSTRLTPDQARVEVTVRDTGMGMNPEEVGRLFNAFAQGDHAGSAGSHRFGGLGLGLAISRMLVELHSGRIWGASDGLGLGSTFTVQIPRAVPAGATASPAADPSIRKPALSSGSRPTRILLVEDHEPTRASLVQLLARRHYDVTEAGGYQEAIAIARTQKFDLLVTDIGLPDGDGYQLLRTLRLASEIIGIALTGYGMEEDIEKSRRAGFATHLTKPIRVQDLDAALASAAAVAPN